MFAANRELQGAIKDLARRVEELEKWRETFRNCIEAGNQVTTTHQERHEVLNERIDTLSARLGLLRPRQKTIAECPFCQDGLIQPPDMAPCPACQEGLVFTPGDADDPPSHDRCDLCGGAREVPEGVAAYVGMLERRLKTQNLQGRGWQESAVYWRKRYNKETAHREKKDLPAAVVYAPREGRTDTIMDESMGREG